MTSEMRSRETRHLTDSRTTPRQVATFRLDDLHFGVDVLKVQEVIKYQALTRVPLAPSAVAGLINLRGEIVAAIELRRRLGLGERPDDAWPMNVVVRTADGLVSLLVDEIDDVIDVDDSQFESPPHSLAGPTRDVVRGVYKLEGRLLLLLDEERAAVVDVQDDSGRRH